MKYRLSPPIHRNLKFLLVLNIQKHFLNMCFIALDPLSKAVKSTAKEGKRSLALLGRDRPSDLTPVVSGVIYLCKLKWGLTSVSWLAHPKFPHIILREYFESELPIKKKNFSYIENTFFLLQFFQSFKIYFTIMHAKNHLD